ncbi:Ribosomal protein S18 acetylase RimI [Saccharopolyspora antimicrobica]|uniref:Ribosomal protein S18 acetylase RimI n=1 Tax=Saccharopolyspora antimicrobica TaxID=455193 RepID=A0A1I4TCE5_9PSEU|nr:GNAT family N-acetyltransferase [Saccharopolyspora antimicrobica]RKT85777.1 ribosomal protein S18 acetylase RimI-like enzyme [Saccharopolyspora antimicrobica]SFM74240.1 Ribosomal protein S18 acetylase RimI [Saccharopolyspora antimicrobica]
MTTIRVARPEEYAAIGEIAVRAYTEAAALPADVDYASVLRDAADRAEKAELLVALTGDKLLGTVTVVRPGTTYAEVSRPGELEFRMLAVAPEAMGNGVGRALVQAVIDRAREQGLERVVLCVKDTSESAQRLYRGLGFQRCPDRDWSPVPDVRLLAFGLDV